MSDAYHSTSRAAFGDIIQAFAGHNESLLDVQNGEADKMRESKRKVDRSAALVANIQAELRERREELSKAVDAGDIGVKEEDIQRGAGVAPSDGGGDAHAGSADGSSDAADLDTINGVNSTRRPSIVLQQNDRSLFSSRFGSTAKAMKEAMRKSNIGNAFGMESVQDRYVRVKKRVAELEKLEGERLADLDAAMEHARKMTVVATKCLRAAIQEHIASVESTVVDLRCAMLGLSAAQSSSLDDVAAVMQAIRERRLVEVEARVERRPKKRRCKSL